MPIYDYRCRGCGHAFEALVLKSTAPSCPQCGAGDLEQVLSTFAVSSAGIRRQNSQSARQAQVNSRESKDKSAAHSEYVKKHND